MNFFSGSVSHQLDGKNRIRIPAKFRSALGDDIVFMVGDQACVLVYPQEALNARLASIGQGGMTKEQMAALRIIQWGTETVVEDDQGRALLSQEFRERLGVTKEDRELVTIGVKDHLEIWLKSKFKSYASQMSFEEAFSVVGFW